MKPTFLKGIIAYMSVSQIYKLVIENISNNVCLGRSRGSELELQLSLQNPVSPWDLIIISPTTFLSFQHLSIINLKGGLASPLLSYLTAYSFAGGSYAALRDILYNNADVMFHLARHI